MLTPDYASRTEEAISLIGNYLKTIPDIETSFTREETALQTSLGTTEAPFSLEISGEDYTELERIVNESKDYSDETTRGSTILQLLWMRELLRLR